MTKRTATLRSTIRCPEGCGRELQYVHYFADDGELEEVLECYCTSPPKRYRIPTMELEVIEEPDVHSAPQTGEPE